MTVCVINTSNIEIVIGKECEYTRIRIDYTINFIRGNMNKERYIVSNFHLIGTWVEIRLVTIHMFGHTND